jgi:hypothetical protein
VKTVTVNGQKQRLTDLEDLSYFRLCRLADRSHAERPTVTWSLPDGSSGTVVPGQRAPLVQGGVYNVALTGNA